MPAPEGTLTKPNASCQPFSSFLLVGANWRRDFWAVHLPSDVFQPMDMQEKPRPTERIQQNSS